MKRRTLAIASALVLVLFASGRLRAKDRAQSRTTGADEFFIISSVDLKKHQLVLKHPTEVTELMQVTEDAIGPIWRRHGVLGLARLLLDIAIRVPAEHLAELRQDVRYGLRMLGESPGFTSVALISLSLGICVATSAFSELNGISRRIDRACPGVRSISPRLSRVDTIW